MKPLAPYTRFSLPASLAVISLFFIVLTMGQGWAIVQEAPQKIVSPGTVSVSRVASIKPRSLHADVPLTSILKPDGNAPENGSRSSKGRINIIQWLFNTLFVVGLGVLVMKQPWFNAWAHRVRELHMNQGIPVGLACLKAIHFNQIKPGLAREMLAQPLQPNNNKSTLLESAPAVAAFSLPQPATALKVSDWCSHLHSITLPTGTHLHHMRIHGQHYVLTETATHSHWLACPINTPSELNATLPPAPAGLSSFPKSREEKYTTPDLEGALPHAPSITLEEQDASTAFLSEESIPQGMTQPAVPRLAMPSPPAMNRHDVMDAQTFFARHSA